MIKGINGINLKSAQQVSFKAQEENQTEPKETKTTNYKSLAIGAAAVTATAIGGLLINHRLKSNQLNKLNKAINELTTDLGKIAKGESDVFDNNILQKYIDEALKLPKKEQLAKLEELSIVKRDRGLSFFLKGYGDKTIADKFKANLPKEVQEAIDSKDQVRATKAYIEYCDTKFYKSKTAGATIQESIENVFGKNSGIKPHTYNPADEAEYIHLYPDKGGYHHSAINSQNQIAPECNWKANSPLVSGYLGHFSERGTIQKDNYNNVQTYVSMLVPNGRSGDRLVLASKDGLTLTPAQKDLLSLDGKLSKEDLELFSKLFESNTAQPDRMNYDALLSTIQTLAGKYAKQAK